MSSIILPPNLTPAPTQLSAVLNLDIKADERTGKTGEMGGGGKWEDGYACFVQRDSDV